MVDSVTADDLPPSYRVEPVNKDAASVQSLAETFRDRAGVKNVILASKTIQLIQDLSRSLTIGIFVVAAFLLFAAGLLVLNTIRMAMFARRREIEVMKLVGATNWFIRVPFMLEGLVQGLLGAFAAIVGLVIIKPFFEGWLPKAEEIPLVSGFAVGGTGLFGIYLLLAVVGAAVGTIGAGVAVTRFLDV
jgi:cell division transport system permease protein